MHITDLFMTQYSTLTRLYTTQPKLQLIFKEKYSRLNVQSELSNAKLIFYTNRQLPNDDVLQMVIAHELAHHMAYCIDASLGHCTTWIKVLKNLGYDAQTVYRESHKYCAPPTEPSRVVVPSSHSN